MSVATPRSLTSQRDPSKVRAYETRCASHHGWARRSVRSMRVSRDDQLARGEQREIPHRDRARVARPEADHQRVAAIDQPLARRVRPRRRSIGSQRAVDQRLEAARGVLLAVAPERAEGRGRQRAGDRDLAGRDQPARELRALGGALG